MVDEKTIKIGNRTIGPDYPPLVIPEIGINHEGDINKAFKMVDDAFGAGAECVKFQCHIVEDEMIYNEVVPANTDESIWEIMSRCALTGEEEFQLKEYVESKGMIESYENKFWGEVFNNDILQKINGEHLHNSFIKI